MRLLRIHCSLHDAPTRCAWSLVSDKQDTQSGQGPLAQLPRDCGRVELVLPAAEVLLTRTQLPRGGRRKSGAILGFAVEDETLGDPETNQTTWLGAAGDADVLAVVDRKGLKRWLDALHAHGLGSCEVHCETLLLPWQAGAWSLGWNGSEGYLRTGELEGTATDCGDRYTPPLSLRMALDATAPAAARPAALALYPVTAEAAPDSDAWQRELGIPVHIAGPWHWQTAPASAGVSLFSEHHGWRLPAGLLLRLRPAAVVAAIAVGVHVAALCVDWSFLAAEQRSLRKQMEVRFRTALPDAVAVVDPLLQMRRKLAEARHAAGKADDGDLLPMLKAVAAAAQPLPRGTLHIIAYESGRMTLELTVTDDKLLRALLQNLAANGLTVEPRASGANRDGGKDGVKAGGSTTIALRAS